MAVPRSTPDYPALLLLNMVLGGQFVSRINMNLREDKGYTYGARTAFDFRRGPGPFQLQASVQTGATAAAIEEVLDGDRRASRTSRPVSAPSWRWRARPSRADTRATSKPPSRSRARPHSSRCTACRTTTSSASCRPLPALELDTLAAVAARHLHPSRLVALVVGDSPSSSRTLGTLPFGDPAMVTPATGSSATDSRASRRAAARHSDRSADLAGWQYTAGVKAIRFHAHGGPDVLRYEDVAGSRAAVPERRSSASARAR